MKDINSRADIELLMDEFYTKLLRDDSINYIFIEVSKINLETHLPIICDFWETVVLKNSVYKKDVLGIHLQLNEKEHLTNAHFTTWLAHFKATVDHHFKGLNADLMKIRAQSIATVMQVKLNA